MRTSLVILAAAAAGFLAGRSLRRKGTEDGPLVDRLTRHLRYLEDGTAVQGGADDIRRAIAALGGDVCEVQSHAVE
jgi:hypothetical protein